MNKPNCLAFKFYFIFACFNVQIPNRGNAKNGGYLKKKQKKPRHKKVTNTKIS